MPRSRRAPELAGIAHDHHDGFLLSWKIRTGLAKGVAPGRMQRYCRRFLREHLGPHFNLEQHLLFPILGLDDPMVRKAIAGQRRLQRLIAGRGEPVVLLTHIEEELEALIRLEEHQLFGRIQEAATPAQLAGAMLAHDALPGPGTRPEDEFWK